MIHPIRLDQDHIYWRPGISGEVKIPGFTEIVTALGVSKPNPYYTEEGRDKGTSLHKWLNILARGKTAKAEPDPRIAGKVKGIEKFLRESGFKYAGGERPLYDPETQTACSPDLWGHLGLWSVVIDAKAGGKLKIHGLQTACQRLALIQNEFRPQKRYGLYLRYNGYRLVEHSDPRDDSMWKLAARCYRDGFNADGVVKYYS